VLRNLPTDSGNLSEGDVVRLVAFVVDAHPSNATSGGETVNCKQNGVDFNDIHIVLGENSNKDDQCTSVTAEMSPHFRPAAWNATALNDSNAHLYRFTGHLFFDASHVPCKGSQPVGSNPKRSSLWEIHPVYEVEICADAGNNCKVDSNDNWIPFDTGSNGAESRLQLPDELERELGSDRQSAQR